MLNRFLFETCFWAASPNYGWNEFLRTVVGESEVGVVGTQIEHLLILLFCMLFVCVICQVMIVSC